MNYIFLFVNPLSGGNKASIFIDIGIKEIIFHKPQKCHLHIYNILDGEKGKKTGFINLSTIIQNKKRNNEIDRINNIKYKISCDDNKQKRFNDIALKSFIQTSELYNSNSNENITKQINKKKSIDDEINKKYITYDKNKYTENKTDYIKQNDIKKDIKDNIYVLVAGGDGTINWFINESENYEIDNDYFAIGVIPFGTGNDFARAFGWQKIDFRYKHLYFTNILKKIVHHTINAEVEKHDYWVINVNLKENGYFSKINNLTKKKETIKNNDINVKNLKFHMSNYFSIGIDSRIGRGFERNRKKNASCNKLIYIIEGFKKMTFKRNIPINLIIDKMVKSDDQYDKIEEYKNDENNNKNDNKDDIKNDNDDLKKECGKEDKNNINKKKNNNNNNENEEVIFTTNNKDKQPLLKYAVNIVCINIPSYSSGNDIWNYTNKVGIVMPKNISNKQKIKYEELKKSKQKVGDGILEFVIFQSAFDLALQFTVKGRAYRIHQGVGPWKIFFKEQKYNVYFQIDGEFYLMTFPNYISIKHYKKVKVLKNII